MRKHTGETTNLTARWQRRAGRAMLASALMLGAATLAIQPPTALYAQQAEGRYVTGEITALDFSTRKLTVKPDAGAEVSITFNEATKFSRLPAGKKSLTEAVAVELKDVTVGDRVLIDKGRAGELAVASKVIVMSRSDVQAAQERERSEWQQGVAGIVTAINPATKEITVQGRGRGMMPGTPQPAPVIVKVSDSTLLRRYAPGSVRFQDAKISRLEDLKVGDQLRARGERGADPNRFSAKEIVSGAFKTQLATVESVNPTTRELTVKPASGGASLVVALQDDTKLKRVPEMAAMMMGGGGRAMGGNREGGNREGGNRNAANREGGNRDAGGGGNRESRPMREGTARGSQTEGAGGGMMRGGNMDLQAMIEMMPSFNVGELKTGDMILFLSTDTPNAAKATAITVVAGVEPLVTAMTMMQTARNAGAGGVGSVGLPAGLDLGIGAP